MALITVRPTAEDIAIANAIAAHTNRPIESAAKALTWGADEHLLLALTAAWWLWSRGQPHAQQRTANHFFVTTLVASGLPHLLKTVFDQRRPDRLTASGHWRGIPLSGKPLDAFPSGHAVHIGALASAASCLPRGIRNVMWLAGAGLVATRIILLAHWTSDVAAGFAIGAGVERWLRRFTGYGGESERVRRCHDAVAKLDRVAIRMALIMLAGGLWLRSRRARTRGRLSNHDPGRAGGIARE